MTSDIIERWKASA